ncbi:hypothetical protein ACJZ2D_000979 [Fusarium nematophilum]
MADSSTPVKLRIWTDYSRDEVLAKTLTLRDRDVVVLLDFLATLVGIVGIVLGKVVVSKATPDCGQWMIKQNGPDRLLVFNELILNATLDADNYAQNCFFGSTKSGIFDCERLMSQSIPFSLEHNASCPFSSEVCRTDGFAMDTGNVSLTQLGLNTRLAHQLYFPRRSVCAPIREDLLHVDTYTSANLTWLSGNETMSISQFFAGPENDTHEDATHWDIQSPAYELTTLYYPLNQSTRQYLAFPLRFSDELSEGLHGPSLVLLSG